MTFRNYLVATALGTSVLLGGALTGQGALVAQTADEAALAVTDDEVSAFASATLMLTEVRDSYIQQIQTAGSEAEQQQLIEQGNAAMIAAVEEAPGMSMERYIEISEAAQGDAALNERILVQIEALTSGG